MGDGHHKHAARAAVGKATSNTATDLTSSTDVAGIGIGKRNLVQTHDLGSQWIDTGAVCDGQDDTKAGCFLTDQKRLKLVIDFLDKTQTAQTNYKTALEELRVEALLDKDSDLNWLVTLMLDVIGAHFVGVFARALGRLRSGQLANLRNLMLEDAANGSFDPNAWTAKVEGVLSKTTDKNIETFVKTAMDTSKKQTSKGLRAVANAGGRGDRNETVSYLDQLKEQCDIEFQEFKDEFRGWRDDGEMAVMWEGMDPHFHSVGAYKDALSAKLQRFKASGVTEIGRRQTVDRVTGDADVYRDTRVIWLKDSQGNKTLWYQSQDGNMDPEVLHKGDPGYPGNTDESMPFGPREPREKPVLGRRVPDEFIEAALARSEAAWGPAPVVFSPAHDLAARWTGSQPVPRLQLRDITKDAATTGGQKS